MPFSWFERSQDSLTEAFTRRLLSRAGSVFRVTGEEACRSLATATFAALLEDLRSNKREAIRAVVLDFVQRLTPSGLGFADIRFFGQSLRTLVQGGADEAQLSAIAEHRQLDNWLYEVLLVGTMRFMAQRDELLQERAAKQEVQKLESQLGELRLAFEEKARLLEVIRQASTPIAPVADGIIVVPLVGVFDTFRTQLLTDKVLQAVVETEAQVVIVDISGVPVFDVEAAQMVIRLAQAVRLLGAEMILVGVSSTTARTIVELDVDLGGLKTLGTLQDGLAHAYVLKRTRSTPLQASR